MILRESGRFPLSVLIKIRMVSFCFNIHIYTFKWLSYISAIINNTGFSFLWLLHDAFEMASLPLIIKRDLQISIFKIDYQHLIIHLHVSFIEHTNINSN